MKILIRNASIIVGDAADDFIIKRGDLAIEEDRIIKVADEGELPLGWQADKEIDGSNKAVLPGFVNTHTHAAMALFRSYADDLPLMKWLKEKIWPLEEKLTAEDVYWGSMLAICEMLKSGTTTFADMYFYMDEVARAVEESGIRACLSRGIVMFTAEESIPYSKAFVQKWQNAADGRITTMLGPHAPYTCPPDLLKDKVIPLATELGVGMHIHLAETKGEVEDMKAKYGMTPIKLMESIGLFELHVLAAHVVHPDAEEMAILKAHNVSVAHNPESNLKLASGIAPVPEMLEAGINVSLGTDGAASNNNLDMLSEMRTMALIHKATSFNPEVIPAKQALKVATLNGARALGLKEVGKLAPGMKADLICIDLNKAHMQPLHNIIANIVYAAHPSDVTHTIVNGKILVEDGVLTTIDEQLVIRQAQLSAERLTAI